MDKSTELHIAKLHPLLRAEVTTLVNLANSKLSNRSQMTIVQSLRTFEEQNALYAQGRTTKGAKVTNAKGGQSFHNYGLALDFCLLIDGKLTSWDTKKDWDGDKVADWLEVVNVFRNAGWEWGGTWKFTDNPHLQKVFGNTWQKLLEKHTKNDFIAGTNYVNL